MNACGGSPPEHQRKLTEHQTNAKKNITISILISNHSILFSVRSEKRVQPKKHRSYGREYLPF